MGSERDVAIFFVSIFSFTRFTESDREGNWKKPNTAGEGRLSVNSCVIIKFMSENDAHPPPLRLSRAFHFPFIFSANFTSFSLFLPCSIHILFPPWIHSLGKFQRKSQVVSSCRRFQIQSSSTPDLALLLAEKEVNWEISSSSDHPTSL